MKLEKKRNCMIVVLLITIMMSISPTQANAGVDVALTEAKLCGANRPAVLSATRKMSAHYGLPQNLLMGIIWVESGCNPLAVSDAGAIGLMQVMPSNQGKQFRGRPKDYELFPIDANILWGTFILYEMDYRYCGLWHRYNSRYPKEQLEYWKCAAGAFYEGTQVAFTGVIGNSGSRYAEMVIGAARRVDLNE